MIDVSIIIVGTNEKDFMRGCLDSIYNSITSYKYEVMVVDNASSDQTALMVKECFPNASLTVNKKKLGYIENNNMAMKKALGRYVLLLNADIELKSNTLQETIKFMDEHTRAAGCGCKLLFDDGTVQLTCRRFPSPWTYICRVPHFFHWIKFGKHFATSSQVKKYLMLDYDHREARAVDWIVSAFFLLRKSALDDIGPVGKHLLQPFYLEDVDWCFRAALKGWETYYVPQVEAVHHYQRTSIIRFNKLSFIHLINLMIFYFKNGFFMLLGRHHNRGQTPITPISLSNK